MLDMIEKADAKAPKLILTDPKSAMGVNLFKKCQVILTEMPSNINDLNQMVGRSNRVDWTATRFASFIS